MAVTRRSPHMNVMIEAAEKAGRTLVRDFGEVENLQISKKGPGNFVSAADHKAEKTIKDVLQKARPEYDLLMEESGLTKGTDRKTRWIVDPLDGTTNFLHGIPHWAISIALEKDGETVAGVVYDPIKDEMFWAEKGMGACVNNKRLQVAARSSLKDSVVSSYANDPGTLKVMASGYEGMSVRMMGSASLGLAYVAAGRFDAYWETGLQPWDTAAGSLLVKEARGVVTDLSGGKDFVYGKTILAGNNSLHTDLLKMLKVAPAKVKTAEA